MRPRHGFTLVEVVLTIVIVGILAAVVLPKFIDLRSDATLANAKGVYGAANSAALMNFAAARVGRAGIVPITSGATLLATLDAGTQSTWFAPGGPYMWNPSSTYGIEVVQAETATSAAVLAIVDSDVNRVFP